MSARLSPLHFEPSSVFLNQPIDPPKWIWENQLAEGCVTFLVGQPKTGKSSLVRSLIKSIASGSPFLGYKTTVTSIAYIALEDHASFLQDSFRRAEIDFNHVHLHYGAISNDDVNSLLECLRITCLENCIKLVIIDPMIKFINITDTNDYSQVYKKLTKLVEFARENNVHILMIHHANKGKEESPNQILGSTGLFGSSDGAFFISRKGNVGTIKSNLRYGNSLESLNFRFDEKGLLQFEGTKAKNELDSLCDEVLDFITDRPRVTAPDIRKQIQIRSSRLQEALVKLLEQGQIERIGSGKSNDPFYYLIPKPEALGAESEKL